MTKTRVSITLDSNLVEELNSDSINKSAFINTLLNRHRITVNYIESAGLAINFDEVIELGLEQLKAKADSQRSLQRFTQAMSEHSAQIKAPNRNIFIRDNIASCATWQQLVELAAEHSIDLSAITPANTPQYFNHPFYYESDLVMRATNDNYTVNKIGQVIEN
jgi:ribonuclease HI